MSRILEIIGRNVRRHRKQQDLTQEKLAERSGLHRTYVGAVERGERNISAKNIAHLAQALEVEPHSLLESKIKHTSE